MGDRKPRQMSKGKAARPGGEGGMPDALANLIGYHLRVAQEASFHAIRQAAGKSSDLKPGWYTILMLLSDNPGLKPTELSRLCGRDRSTLSSTLKALSARGLILRRRTPGDQRSYGVRLTAAGESMLKQLRIISRIHDARLDALVGKDKLLLIALLRRIVDGLAQPHRLSLSAGREGISPAARVGASRAKVAGRSMETRR